MAGSASAVGNDVAATMERASSALRGAVKVALADAVKVARKELESTAKPYTGGDMRFSNLRNVRASVKSKSGDGFVTVYASGPWGLLQPGARPHLIGSGVRRMPVGSDIVRFGPFRHPGTRNTRAWDRGRDSTFSKLGSEIPEQIGDDVEAAF